MPTLHWLLPVFTSGLSFVFAILLGRQWAERRHAYQLVWTLGLVWYGIAAGTEVLGNAFGWSDVLFRGWYLFGAIMVAAYLGAGEVYLLSGTRFGYLVALSVLLGAIPALAGGAPLVGLAGIVAAGLIALTQRLRPARVAHVSLGLLALGTLVGAVAVARAPIDAALMLNPATDVVQGNGFPQDVRLLTPLFNIAGGMTLVFGAAFSAWHFWQSRLMPRRVVSGALVALGGFIPSITSSLSRFGFTSAFYLGETLGVLCIFAGFLVSTEVFARRSRPARPEPRTLPA